MESPNKDDLKGDWHEENLSDTEDDDLWEDSCDSCFLCDNPMEPSESCVVKKRGISRLIQSSIKRNDGKDLKLRTLREVAVHQTCRRMYLRESNIKTPLKKSNVRTVKAKEAGGKRRLVGLAAEVILQDIRARKFGTDSSTNSVNNGTGGIPETLKLFLDILIKTHKRSSKGRRWAKWEKIIIAVAYILISFVIPQTFISPIVLELSNMVLAKFAEKVEANGFDNSVEDSPSNFHSKRSTGKRILMEWLTYETSRRQVKE
ncbi:uncharacterized protein [Venturia canescens]|uniref:uncharacterized protein n=1 Tax=Venturia canescens TaxID=32260 RepID=UPI001C9D2648|nr:uncharacterized protein LOC122416597 [Venturia canescens]